MNQFTSPRALGILLLVNAALFARTPIYTTLKAESMASGAGVGLAVIFAMVLVLLNFGLGIYLLAKKTLTAQPVRLTTQIALRRPQDTAPSRPRRSLIRTSWLVS